MFKITCASLIAIGQTAGAPIGKGQQWVLKLVQFFNFQNHRGMLTTTCESFIAIG